MNNLDQLLREEDPTEHLQRLHNGQNINDMGLKYGPGIIPRIPKSSFFSDTYVTATKQHRYSYMPAHTHSFIEINYQYSGKSEQQLSGTHITLKKDQILIMDQALIQKYGYMGENDLLVNILLNINQLPPSFLTDVASAGGFNRFLYNAINSTSNHENYLIFDLSHCPVARNIWHDLMLYCLTNQKPVQTRGLLLKAALSCLPTASKTHLHVLNNSFSATSDIIDYMDQHYQAISLKKVSQHFGYNSNYLGNKLKSDTGLSFKELINRKRIMVAESYLLDTNLTAEEITVKLGFRNTSSFFRLFKQQLNTTPLAFRTQHNNENNY